MDVSSYIVLRLCCAMSTGDHDIVAGQIYTMLNAALALAVKNDRYQHTQDLLVAGADANLVLDCNFSILHVAILSNSRGCHILLLKHGAHVNACGGNRWMPNTWMSPLTYEHDLNFLLSQCVPKIDDLYSPLAYAMKLKREGIAWDLLQAGAEVSDIKEEDLPTAIEIAVQLEDPYLIYLISFEGYHETHEKPGLDSDHPLREACIFSQAHFVRSPAWPLLYHRDILSRYDFEILWT